MGVYIKGMEMPKTEEESKLLILTPDGVTWLTQLGLGNQKFDTIEVPQHGRLIDADALIEDLERQCKEVFRIDAVSPDDYWITRNEAYNEALWKTWVESFDNYLKTRQTVIPEGW